MQAAPATAAPPAPDPAAVSPAPTEVPPQRRLVVAQLLAAGEPPALAAAMAGLTRPQLRTLEADPDFQELLRDCRAVEALPVAEQNARLERLVRRAAERLLAEARVGAVGAGLRLLEHVTAPDPSGPAPERSTGSSSELARAFRAWARARHGLPDPAPAAAAAAGLLRSRLTPAAGGPDGRAEAALRDALLDRLDAAPGGGLAGRAEDRTPAPAAVAGALGPAPSASEPARFAAAAAAPTPAAGSGTARRPEGREVGSPATLEPGRDTAPGPARAQGQASAPTPARAAVPGPARAQAGGASATARGPARAQAAPERRPHGPALASVAEKLGGADATAPDADGQTAAESTGAAARAQREAAAAPVRADHKAAKKVHSRSIATSIPGSTAAPYAREVAKVLTPAPSRAAPAHPGAAPGEIGGPAPPALAPTNPTEPAAPAPAPGSIEDLAARLERLLAAEFAVTAEEADLADAVCALQWPNWPAYQGGIDLHRLRWVLHGSGLDPPRLQRLGSRDFTAPLRDPWHPANRERRAHAATAARSGLSRPDPAGRNIERRSAEPPPEASAASPRAVRAARTRRPP